MIALEIEHIKDFMNRLLLQPVFDSFLVSEASISTFTTFTIDGSLHRDFYDTDEAEQLKEDGVTQVSWAMIRPFCLSVFKGKRLPISFRFVLQLPKEKVPELLEENGFGLTPDDVFGLFLNIQYRNNVLTVTTGSSLRIFTVDKSLDLAWDRYVQEFLAVQELD